MLRRLKFFGAGALISIIFLSLGTEQFVSIGENSPTFNRARVSYTKFIPVRWLKISKLSALLQLS